eukprot:TRINITY_DN3260_c0_g3_i2.p1 TRINITY_DN3260_c0_g3~~TRINITY_DN3260_c0_g3_i2.p1  ORF type:complete len:103 (+),score=12.57 TRINITY_DN3260_c0_g3_i2:1172-1480(+)
MLGLRWGVAKAVVCLPKSFVLLPFPILTQAAPTGCIEVYDRHYFYLSFYFLDYYLISLKHCGCVDLIITSFSKWQPVCLLKDFPVESQDLWSKNKVQNMFDE